MLDVARTARRPGRAQRILRVLCAVHAATVLAAALTLQYADDLPIATLLAFAPRWPLALPVALLAPWALLARAWTSACLSLGAAGVVAGPVMGAEPSVERLADAVVGEGDSPRYGAELGRLRIVTCNTDGEALDAPALARFIDDAKPDVVALQEAALHAAQVVSPYPHVRRAGQYLLGSRYPLSEPVALPRVPSGIGVPGVHLTIAAPFADAHMVVVHLMSPRQGLNAALQGRGLGLLDLNSTVRHKESASILAEGARHQDFVVAGDLNTPPFGVLYEQWSRLQNAFSRAGTGYGFTHRTKRSTLRIDHVFVAGRWRPVSVQVGPFVGSEHRPLLAELAWTGPAPRGR